jgi:lysophospholipase L1-like esterase
VLKRFLGSTAFYAVYLTIAVFVLCELATRAYFAFQVGPRALMYGTEWYRNVAPDEQAKRWGKLKADPEWQKEAPKAIAAEERPDSVERHKNELAGYTKFFPNEPKTTRDAETGERIVATINRHGFRGKEFELVKPKGSVRVLTLGASSTFGYYDRDDETYPHYLELELNRRCPSAPRFEVINFGIPHSTSDQMAALFLAEGLPLHPDVVTFYEGRNDSTIDDYSRAGVPEKIYAVLIHRLMLVAFIDQVVVGDRASVTAAAKQFEPHVKRRTEYFLNNLTRILTAAREHGVHVVIANQQASSSYGFASRESERLSLRRGVTYAEETQAIKERVARGETIGPHEYTLLVHERLMKALEEWAAKNGVPFVDVISAMDHDRHHLVSWVHLDAAGNRVVAAKLAEPILREFCAGGAKPIQ